MSKLLVITGITGRQGSAVAHFFLDQPGWKLRGTTRNPDSASAREWAAKGVEIVAAEFDDLDSLINAFHGATHVFAVTDFLAGVKDPKAADRLKPGQSIGEYALEAEVPQSINLAKAAAVTSSLERYVFSTLPDPKDFAHPERFHNLYHFMSKRPAGQYIQNKLPDLYKKYNEIQLSIYNENLLADWFLGPKLEDGKVYMDFYDDGNGRFVHTAVADTGPGLLALFTKGQPGSTLAIDSDILSLKEALETICRVKGYIEGGVRNLGWETYTSHMLPPIGDELGKTHLALEEWTKLLETGKTHTIRFHDLGIKGTRFEDWVRQHEFAKLNGVKAA